MHGEWMIIYVLCLQVRRRVKNLVEREWERKRGRVVLEGGRRKRGSVITAVGRFVGSLCVSQQPVALTDYSGTVPGLWEQGLKCLKDTVNLMVMYLIKALLFLSAGFQRMYCDTDLRKSVSFISLLLLFQIVTLRVLSFNVRVYSGQLCVCVCVVIGSGGYQYRFVFAFDILWIPTCLSVPTLSFSLGVLAFLQKCTSVWLSMSEKAVSSN